MTHPFDRTVPLITRQLGAHCGITLMGRPTGGSDASAAKLENWQFVLGEGPAVACCDAGRSVQYPDLDCVYEWFPLFAAALHDAGINSVAAVPINTKGTCLGALTVYSVSQPLKPKQLRRAEQWAQQVALFVAADPESWADQRQEVAAQFDTAIGCLMFTLRVDAPTASAFMRAHAFAESIPLPALCDKIVHDNFRLDLEPQWRSG